MTVSASEINDLSAAGDDSDSLIIDVVPWAPSITGTHEFCLNRIMAEGREKAKVKESEKRWLLADRPEGYRTTQVLGAIDSFRLSEQVRSCGREEKSPPDTRSTGMVIEVWVARILPGKETEWNEYAEAWLQTLKRCGINARIMQTETGAELNRTIELEFESYAARGEFWSTVSDEIMALINKQRKICDLNGSEHYYYTYTVVG